jgi:hypothetical protein
VSVGEVLGVSVASGGAVGFPLGRNAKKEKRIIVTSMTAIKSFAVLLVAKIF